MKMNSRSKTSRAIMDLDDEEIAEIFTTPSPTPPISYRPIRCPISDCRRIISGNALGAHFKHEHHKIPKHYVTYNMTTQIQFNLDKLVPGKTYCSAILLLARKGQNLQNMKIEDFVVIPVLTTRLKCIDDDDTGTGTECSNIPKCSFSYDLPSTSRDRMQDNGVPKQRYSTDTVTLWLSALSPGDKECCITGLNEEKSVKYHYCGAIHSIRDSSNIEDVLPKGNHLMLLDTNLRKHPEKGLHLFRVTVMQNKLCEPCS